MNLISQVELCNCFAARKVARHVTKLYERHLSPMGLTGSQFSMLALLVKQSALSFNDMSAVMYMERTTMVRAFQPLQRDGLVLSRPDKENSRVLRFSLSAKGKATFNKSVPFWLEAQREFEEGIGASRATQLRNLAAQI